jgi:2'-5' RNA ligase
VRLFVAVDVPDDIKDAIERDVVSPMRGALDGAKWTRPEGRHLTLKFLGDVADELVTGVGGVLAEAASRHVGFDAAFAELGGFPNVRRPRVLWLGIGTGAEQLAALAADVEDVLQPMGFPGEDRPFTAHFTLARFPKPRIIEKLPLVTVPGSAFRVGEVVLFRSQLHPKGARYTALERHALR